MNDYNRIGTMIPGFPDRPEQPQRAPQTPRQKQLQEQNVYTPQEAIPSDEMMRRKIFQLRERLPQGATAQPGSVLNILV
jgi:hypothetical protein